MGHLKYSFIIYLIFLLGLHTATPPAMLLSGGGRFQGSIFECIFKKRIIINYYINKLKSLLNESLTTFFF